MIDYKIILGISASVLGFIGYVPYFRDIFQGRTKPHIFSWFVWSLLTGIAFFAQLSKGAGAGAWVTGFTAAVSLSIAILAFFRGEKHITKIDWATFIGALSGLIFWGLTANPLSAVIIITVTDALAFAPTFRKSYCKPHEETASTFALSALKFVFGLAALQSYNLTTWLYPASLVLMNGLFVVMLLLRRHILKSTP